MKKILVFAFATLVMFACAGSLMAHPPNEMSQKECLVKLADTSSTHLNAVCVDALTSIYNNVFMPNEKALSFEKECLTLVELADSIPVMKSVCNSVNSYFYNITSKNCRTVKKEFFSYRDLPLQVGWCNC